MQTCNAPVPLELFYRCLLAIIIMVADRKKTGNWTSLRQCLRAVITTYTLCDINLRQAMDNRQPNIIATNDHLRQPTTTSTTTYGHTGNHLQQPKSVYVLSRQARTSYDPAGDSCTSRHFDLRNGTETLSFPKKGIVDSVCNHSAL